MSNSDTVFIVNSRKAWGKGDYKTNALQRMAENWRGGVDDTETISIVHCRNFQGMEQTPFASRVNAEEIIDEQKLEIDGDKFQKLMELITDIEIMADELLSNGNEITEEEQ